MNTLQYLSCKRVQLSIVSNSVAAYDYCQAKKLSATANGGQHRNHPASESITFRFDKDTMGLLREEAVAKEISLNTLVSQIIREHLHYGVNAPKAGLVPISKNALTMLLEDLTDEEISRIAKASAKNVSDIIILLRSEFTIEAALDVLESWLKATGFHYKHTAHSGRILFVIQHDMGRKWSIYLSEYMKHVMEQFGKRIRPKTSDNNIAVEFELE